MGWIERADDLRLRNNQTETGIVERWLPVFCGIQNRVLRVVDLRKRERIGRCKYRTTQSIATLVAVAMLGDQRCLVTGAENAGYMIRALRGADLNLIRLKAIKQGPEE